jgi:K+-transporting ATPase ATPase C chain
MLTDLKAALRPTLVMTLLFALVLGLIYPAVMTGLGQLVFPAQANGSLVRDPQGRIVGSVLIGQAFASPGYFHGRPSAAGKGYDALASGGSNLGPASAALSQRIAADVKAARVTSAAPIPADLLTTSGSGLDPDISPDAARYQVPRVAALRHADPAAVRALVDQSIDRPLLGVVGEPRVNVLALNRALDHAFPRP